MPAGRSRSKRESLGRGTVTCLARLFVLSAWLGPGLVSGLASGLASGCASEHARPPRPQAKPQARPQASLGAAAKTDEATDPSGREPFLARRFAHTTKLSRLGPAPAKAPDVLEPPPGVREVRYPSGDLRLLAWYGQPRTASARATPALVYFHGDFAFGADDFEAVRPFVDAGFVVMTPTLRGENGNPGDFELLWGEVDDARAAIAWLADQPMVDPRAIYAFGHSIGGGISALLSLYPDVPLRATGSSGGIYVPETFVRWAASESNADLVRFDPRDPDESELRVLGPNLPWMVHRHIAYIGRDDRWFIDNGERLAARAWQLGQPFEVLLVDGDHMQSLAPAVAAFLEFAKADRLGR